MRRLVFDIKTDSFSQSFLVAESEEERIRHAPKLRAACVFDESTRKYSFYAEAGADNLVPVLQAADEIISFNGTGLDLVVLRKHYGLMGPVPRIGKHLDLHTIMSEMAGFPVSLNLATTLNLDQSKHTSDRPVAELNIRKLKIASKSDVKQTYRLWQLLEDGKLVIPQRPSGHAANRSEYGEVGAGLPIPSECPFCHDAGSLELEKRDPADIPKEQVSDYISGTQKSAICHTCDYELDWKG